MRETRSSGSVEGVVRNPDSESDWRSSLRLPILLHCRATRLRAVAPGKTRNDRPTELPEDVVGR